MRGLVNKIVSRSLSVGGKWQQQQLRRLNIHEYQGAELMGKYGVNVPEGVAVSSLDEVKKAIQDVFPNESERMKSPKTLEVWKLGTVNYLKSLKVQDKLVSERKAQRIPDTLLSLQHPPTYTLGKRRTDHNLLIPESKLTKIGAELHYTQRGGDITYHGPHQAILYPIISLRSIGIGARCYVETLERSMIDFASIYGVKARAGNKYETGVWVGDRKIGAIGVQISSGITYHGLAFNIDPDLTYFEHIVPCGIADKKVTSLRRETDALLPSEETIHEQLVSCWAKAFSYDDVVWKEDPSVILDSQDNK